MKAITNLGKLLQNPDELNRLLRHAVKESLSETYGDLLENEKEEQEKLAKKLKQFSPSEKPKDQDEGEDEPVDAAKDEEAAEEKEEEVEVAPEDAEPSVLTPEELEEIDIDAVIDQLNSMRSGKSLKDEEVRLQLSDYYEGLSSGEKKSLFAFLQGLSDIMSGGIEGADAPKPATYKIRTSSSEPEKKKEKESVVATASGDKDEEEITPIVVGEHADKRAERKRLRELMRS